MYDGIAMYGAALIRLANLVGVRQADIARHLGITRVQVNHWAHCVRPIPEASVPPLVEAIRAAVERCLQAGEPGSPTQAELTDVLRDVFAENCHRYGHAEAPTLEAFLEEMRRYAALTSPQRRAGPQLEHIEKLTAIMLCWFGLLDALRPLLDVLPDGEQPFPASSTGQKRVRTT